MKGPLLRRRMEHMHEWGGERFLIKNVQARVCDQCGEAFLAPATLKQIDELLSNGWPNSHVSLAVFNLKSRTL